MGNKGIPVLDFSLAATREIKLFEHSRTRIWAQHHHSRRICLFPKGEVGINRDHPRWFNKTRYELRLLGVPDNLVHLLDWDSSGNWYKIEQFRETIGDEANFDFALIDGPNQSDGKSRGIRDNGAALVEIRRSIYEADIVIVDDVHRRHILDSVDAMLGDPNHYEKWFYDYSVVTTHSNTLCICVKKASRISAELVKIQSILDLPLYATLERANCPED